MSQEELPLGQTDIPSQFRNFMRVAATVGNNNMGPLQRIEDVTVAEGSVTLSFYAKGSNPAAGSFSLAMYQAFGSGGSTGVSSNQNTFVVTSSWQRFEFTLTLPSLSGKTVGTGSSLEIFIYQDNADTGTAAWTLDITGVCLNVGDSAIDFPHESYGDTLAKCQRYFYRYTGPSDDRWGVSYSYNNSTTSTSVSFPVTMRSTPTGVVSSNGLLRVRDLADGTGGDVTPSTLTCGAITKDRWKIFVNAQLSNAAQILAFSTKLDFDAEL
jgi:hypothetical protein